MIKPQSAKLKMEITSFEWKIDKTGIEYTLRIDGEICYQGFIFEDVLKEMKKYMRLRFKESIK